MDFMDRHAPPRTSLLPRDRPRSYAASHASAPSARRASNRAKVDSASPEVISSLISSLSTISALAESHVDSLPRISSADSVSSSPIPSGGFSGQSTRSASFVDGSLALTSAANGTLDEARNYKYLHPDDAAMAPAVRTSKPRSVLSPITVPERRASSLRSRPGSRESHMTSSQRSDGLWSIGNLSIEPGPKQSPPLSAKSTGSPFKIGIKIQKSLDFKSSKEKMREIDREHKRKAVKNYENHKASVTSPQKDIQFSRKSPSFTNGHENEPSRATYELMHTPHKSQILQSEDTTAITGNGRKIPTRESSLRYSIGATLPRRKRRFQKSEQITAHEKGETVASKEEQASNASPEIFDNTAEDDVSRRIRELKMQKEIRDRRQVEDVTQIELESKKNKPLGHPSLPAQHPSQTTPRSPGASTLSQRLGKENQDVYLRSDQVSSEKLLTSVIVDRQVSEASYIEKLSKSSVILPPAVTVLPSKLSRTSMDLPKARPRAASPSPSGRNISHPLSQVARTSHYDDRPSTADSIDDDVEIYLSSSKLSKKIYHPQIGRVIAFSDVGDPNGSVVFCCVGMGLTRYLSAFYDELASTLKLRLITPDRPGVGESEPYSDGSDTPLGWPDDIRAICQHLCISRFSILAHSAGAIYALATALRMPQHIRGRIHLLAPWIPPSQISAIGTHQGPLPQTVLPYSHRILRSLPTTFLKAANSSFFSISSASITASFPKSPKRGKRKSFNQDASDSNGSQLPTVGARSRRGSMPPRPALNRSASGLCQRTSSLSPDSHSKLAASPTKAHLMEKERQIEYDARLTHAIWELSTTNANPAIDLLVCLERRQEIGFRYVDINKAVVIHHGTRDTRVPVENVKWLGKTMRKCEVRVLEGEGHGLMASAAVMGSVLTEIAKEWDDWNVVVSGRKMEK